MAIKNRRGVYTDFNPTNMVEGEFAIVQSGDPTTESGEAVYICFIAGSAIRVATYSDIIRNIAGEYSSSSTYAKNQLVFHDGILYRSKTAISTPEEWLSTRWERVYISDSLIVPGSGTNAELFNEVSTNTASGTSSHAEGRNARATGKYTHAEGLNTEASGPYAHAEGYSTHATATNYSSHAEGYMSTASGNASHAEGYNTKAINMYSHSENYLTEAQGNNSHAEGSRTKTTGTNSHAEGQSTTASGTASHAEGRETTASGINSHAEGYNTQALASFYSSHAEGYTTIASGNASHAEGHTTTASGQGSHSEGRETVANHAYQHVFGAYNIEDPSTAVAGEIGTYVEIVGNGTSTANRSNARTLDWNGNETLAGKLTVGASPVNDMDVATKAYADSIGSSIAVSYTDPNNDGNIVISMGGL